VTKIGPRRRSARWAVCAVLFAGAATLSGCKVVTLDQDQAIRAKRSLNFKAADYVAKIWDTQALPAFRARAAPAKTLFPAIDANADEAGARLGRRAGEGAPWTFVVSGEGVVTTVDSGSRRRTIAVTLGDGVSRSVKLQAGPVVVGTSLRDALPFIAFDDFTDQLAYADVGRALTNTALSRLAPTLNSLKPGDEVRFVGAFDLAAADQPLLVTPVLIDKLGSRGVVP